MSKPKFVAIDGNSLLYRAFYAMPYLSTSEGLPTNAVYGFTTMLLRLLEEEKPAAIVVAFDAKAKTFRHEAYSDYKAHRPATPDDLSRQVPLAREVVRALRIRMLELPGYEADDCVATMAVRARDEGYSVLIVTGDLDELQVVGPDITVMTTRRGVTDTMLYDSDAVQERFGLRPDQMVDFKALRGDPSDNVPGVKGIGEKTAAKLLAQFGTLENLLAHLDDVKETRVRELLRAGAEAARMSKHLCTINLDSPCQLPVAECQVQPPDIGAVRALFSRLEFRSLLARLEAMTPPAPQTAAPTPPATHMATPVRTEGSNIADALSALSTCQSVAAALHLDGQDPLRSPVLGLVLHGDPGTTFYIPADAVPELRPFLSGSCRRLVTHDLKRLLQALGRYLPSGSDLCVAEVAAWMDTMIAAYVLNPGRNGQSLGALAQELLGLEIPQVQASGRGLLAGAETDEEALVRLGAEASATRELAQVLEKRLRSDGLWELYADIEHPLIRVLAEMECRGVLVDKEVLASLSVSLAERIRQLEGEIHSLAGVAFNVASTKQLQSVLFERLKLPVGKKTKTGLSTDTEVLESLAAEHPIAGKIVAYRELTKLKSTYVDALTQLIDPDTGRVHTSLNQAVTATGRLSSSNPNLQNIPIRTEVGREIRRAFVASPGNVMLSADYSQIELRILAHITGEPELVRAFEADEDIHTHTAATIFGVPHEAVTAEMRRRAKAVNFAVLYGMTDFGLSRELGIPVAAAHQFIKGYFARFPGVQRYIKETVEEAKAKGYVTTLLGRRRYIPELTSGNRNIRSFAERAAVNSPIQGTAADIIKLAMVRLDARIKREGSPAQLLLQVHDELLLEVPEARVGEAARMVREEMEGAYPLRVRVKVDVKYGPNWSDMQEMVV